MLKYKYKFHPDDYTLGENEKFYSDMEARGWRLVKRGSYLSKFRLCEPADVRYRIEVVSTGFLEDPGMREEQVAVFEDCGWEYVTWAGLLHVFRAPADSDAPEFYVDPRQQAATLKSLRRSYVYSWIPVVIVVLLNLSMAAAMRGDLGGTLARSLAEAQLGFVVLTAPSLLVGTMLLYGVYQLIRGAVQITRTYRRMKKGIPLDHDPKGKRIPHRIVSGALFTCMAVCAVLSLWQVIDYEKYPLPAEADGPYLLLWDMGYEGERTYLVYRDNKSQVERSRSLMADYWATREALGESNGADVWMYQDVYRLRDEMWAEDLAWILMSSATFIQEPENFVPRSVPGLDAAWTGGLEAVAVKGNMVAYITCSSLIGDNGEEMEKVLTALAEKWQ